ncbi:MAG TPA: undecaprenyl-phosphate glucose phosphotransferase [Sphingobacteriaceae bacterium]
MIQNRFLYAICILLSLSDLLILNGSFFLGKEIIVFLGKPNFPQEPLEQVINMNLLWIICSYSFRLYSTSSITTLEQIFRNTWKSACLHLVFFGGTQYFLEKSGPREEFLLIFYSLLVVTLLISRFLCTLMESVFSKRFQLKKNVAVLGSEHQARQLASFFESNKQQFAFTGFLDDEPGLYVDESGQLAPGICQKIRYAAENNIRDLYVVLTAERLKEASHLLQEAEKQCVRIKLVPDFSSALSEKFMINYMGQTPVISLRSEPLDDVHSRFKKRTGDIIVSVLVIIFIMSWLFPIVALLIKLESKGPVLFKQLRTGRDDRPFWCYKFRSMKLNEQADSSQAKKGDERVTRIGKLLRKTSLDEFPQFINVLFGDMSIVGPRPHMIRHTEEYRAIIDQYMVRQHARPGITGWAQVNGFRGETRTQDDMKKRVEHDIWYLENWSLMLDVKIIFLTIINVIRGEENAY